MPTSNLTQPPKAYLFDVFGTVVNWRHGLTRNLQAAALEAAATTSNAPAAAQARAFTFTHWEGFASEWYYTYINYASRAMPGVTPYVNPSQLYLSIIRVIIPKWGLEGLWSDEQLAALPKLWHSFDAWPDSAAALKRISAHGPVASLSDGSVALMTDLARLNSLEWTKIYGSDSWERYKPDPEVYLSGVRAIGDGKLAPGDVALVAAHLGDLHAAKKAGLKAIYLERPLEERWSPEEAQGAKEWVDVWIGMGEGGLAGVADVLDKTA